VLRVYHSGVVTEWRERERELRALGCDLRLVSAQSWNEAGRDVRFEPAGDDFAVTARTLGTHPYRFVYDPRPIVRELRRRKLDVLDAHEEPASLASFELRLLAWLFQRGVPIIFYGAQNIEKRFPVPFRWIERGSLRRAAAVYCCNIEAGKIFIRKGLRGRVATIGLGVDVDRFSPSDMARRAGPFRVGYFGRLESYKGVQVLIDAVATLPGIELILHGDGSTHADLTAQVERLGIGDRVRFAGFTEQSSLPAAYHDVDVVAVPSLRTRRWVEQFGRVAVEAMASGVPVVASDEGALPDVVSGAGILVAAGDVAAWCDALASLAGNSQQLTSLRAAGLERARVYRWSNIAAEQHELYESVAR
jgi:glycosyltransferase involved in cell wall biosynthesis